MGFVSQEICLLYFKVYCVSKSVCFFVNSILYQKKSTQHLDYSPAWILKINTSCVVWSVLFYKKFAFYIVKYIIHFVSKIPTCYLVRCIYIIRNVPVIFLVHLVSVILIDINKRSPWE